MSRIGKQEISVPKGVDLKLDGSTLTVKGPKGTLTRTFETKYVSINIDGGIVKVANTSNDAKSRSFWGLTRTLVNNMVVGVSDGFKKSLEFNGVGYRAAVSGSTLTLNLGYSHPIDYKIPEGIKAAVTKNVIDFEGCDKELVGFVAAKVRSFRKPEPYKGKGIKYTTETIIRKAGKTGGKK
ncbi:50S ribosomal protein L6 [Bacteriovoracaceae bacterium]|nr:50S ribosomal protein L6 [Bacteriovoracaceae bacterium]